MESSTANFIDKRNLEKSVVGKYKKRWIRALYFCNIAGFMGGLFGLFLNGLAFFGLVENAKAINRIGTWLIVAAFPLVMFGAHAMDKIEEIERNEKRKAFETRKLKFYSPEQWKEDSFSQL